MKKAYNTHEKKTREIQVSRQFFDLISSNTTDSLISPDQIFAVTAEFLSQLADTGITPEAALRKIFPYAKPVPWLAKFYFLVS